MLRAEMTQKSEAVTVGYLLGRGIPFRLGGEEQRPEDDV